MNPILNLRKRPQLALLFTALLVLFCRGPQSKADRFGPGCIVYINYFENGSLVGKNDQYECPITCPDGSTVIGKGQEGDKYSELEADGLKQCTAPAATTTPTATTSPQETSTATAAPAQPLTGEVTACNLIDGFINFKLTSTVSNTGITFNGYPVKCEVPASNPNVITCIVPPGQNFPMLIEVEVSGQPTDSFTFDGSGCVQFAPTKSNPLQDPPSDGEPTCTGVPPYPEGCTPP
jgi:hypothetical protein